MVLTSENNKAKDSSSNDHRKKESRKFMKEKWQQITKNVAESDSSSLSDKGSLVVAGSGIMCVGHFTLETLGHIKDADKVFYLVADPVTEVRCTVKPLQAIALYMHLFQKMLS
jgi:hypothetical protein